MNVIYTTGDGIAYGAANGVLLGFEFELDSVRFVTDRSQDDVNRWKELHDKGWEAMSAAERAEWTAGMKGAYKHTDLNRVEMAVESMIARLATHGKKLPLVVKTDWVQTDRPLVSDMERYFGNVEALRVATGVTIDAPPTPTTQMLFDYKKANDLEEILQRVEFWLDRVAACQNYSGDLYLGEV